MNANKRVQYIDLCGSLMDVVQAFPFVVGDDPVSTSFTKEDLTKMSDTELLDATADLWRYAKDFGASLGRAMIKDRAAIAANQTSSEDEGSVPERDRTRVPEHKPETEYERDQRRQRELERDLQYKREIEQAQQQERERELEYERKLAQDRDRELERDRGLDRGR